ncbi:hypothetical protein NKH57_24130 [Mesorhizobium sp. M1050]|uniref:hypothetical protein n=1 Tax=unclassified Mesorhizobium TaxID=325217 RepID=UPI0003CF7F89|nr:hypothetical protein [Mesorhizobium sp. LNHC252B00]ESY70113.1 hypothetical protein X743_23415 [Mesorhizobium sp. LNHC252B00]
MKHQTVDQLNAVADVHAEATHLLATRGERLERWAQLLEQNPNRVLGALTGTEHQSVETRERMRSAGSPITIAFEDPVFRALGLKEDTYGEAKRFFELTDWQLHGIVCHCHVGATMTARWAASRVRAAMSGRSGFFAWLRGAFMH